MASPSRQPTTRSLTGRVLADAGLIMCAVGVLVGLVFPGFAIVLGVPSSIALTPLFVVSCITAGLMVGGMGVLVIRLAVGRPLARLAQSMAHVRDRLAEATASGNHAECDLDVCRLELASADELGLCASSFNTLLEVIFDANRLDEQIRRLAGSLVEHLDAEAIAHAALEGLVTTGPYEAGAVLLGEGESLALVASVGLDDPARLTESAVVRESMAAGTRTRVEIPEDIAVDAGVLAFTPRVVDVRALAVHGETFGALVLASTATQAAPAERLAEAAAGGLSLALRNALTHLEVEQMAMRDALTGLSNRRCGLARLREEYVEARRTGTSLGVIVFDIDHFKVVNDTHGHILGDRVLQAVAQVAQASIRQEDALARFGGEEFLVVLPGATLERTMDAAERIRQGCAGLEVCEGGVCVRVTVSAGVAADDPSTDRDEHGILVRADEALYAAKRAGRDRIAAAPAAELRAA